MIISTLLFLVRTDHKKITDLCLGLKKSGFGTGRWNGAGSQVNPNESLEDAAKRGAREEFAITPTEMYKVAELIFTYPDNPQWDEVVHVFFANEWRGDPRETDELESEWFAIDAIPLEGMYSADALWLPEALKGRIVRCTATFADHETIIDSKLEDARF